MSSKINHILRQLNRMVYTILLVGYQQCGPTWKRKRKHRFHSFWMITKGSGEFIINGTPHKAEPGKLFVIVPGTVYEARTTDEEGMLEYFFIRFDCATSYEDKEEWHFATLEEDEFPLAGMYTLQNAPQVINLYEQIYHLWQRRGQVVTMRRKILFQELLLAIVQDLRAQEVTGSTTLAIERTIDYMVTRYKENLTLDELAHLAGLSNSHYSRLFKKYSGYSPIDYLTHLRMDRAKELLALSDYRLKAVARSVGYQDEFYFSRIFKKVVGESPSAFAHKHRTNQLKNE